MTLLMATALVAGLMWSVPSVAAYAPRSQTAAMLCAIMACCCVWGLVGVLLLR